MRGVVQVEGRGLGGGGEQESMAGILGGMRKGRHVAGWVLVTENGGDSGVR